jgi:DNA-binding NarL/FixJ family response regulator
MERAPDSVVVFFGPEDSVVAERAVAAGARGLIRGGEREDLVASVAKALMLLLRPVRAAAASVTPPVRDPAVPGGAVEAAPAATLAEADLDDPTAAQPVPLQRSENEAPAEVEEEVPEIDTRRLTLTERELQVLRGMAEGKSNAEIGRELFVSEDTVKTHARRLFRKLGARDRAHAVAAAFRAGIVD